MRKIIQRPYRDMSRKDCGKYLESSSGLGDIFLITFLFSLTNATHEIATKNIVSDAMKSTPPTQSTLFNVYVARGGFNVRSFGTRSNPTVQKGDMA
jgi:NADPH-dependent 7-cyano-7-deazaguanine reductase QueF